ncbi:MAG TPA: hypothetical protein VNC22_20970 [Sporichthya sp.]|nr:hypothetical protein [Sporichthya sp.]
MVKITLGDSYATLAELRARVKITDASFTAEDARLTSALAVASRGIEKVCNRQFNDAGSTSAREFEPCHDKWLDIDDFSTTTGLVVKFDSAGDGTFATTLAATTYKAYPLNGIVDGESGWPFWKLKAVNTCWPVYWQLPPIQVTARWGWTAVPAAVKEGCLILAEEVYKLADSPFGVGGYSQFGIVRARDNPMVWARVGPYARDPVLVA